MTIYILDENPAKIAEMLDDKSLEKMIKDIAQVLKGCHQAIPEYWSFKNNKTHLQWINWVKEYRANYNYLTSLGIEVGVEIQYRTGNSPNNKYSKAVLWSINNIPDLSTGSYGDFSSEGYNEITPFPLVMPKKYRHFAEIECSTSNNKNDQSPELYYRAYRNYYITKVEQKLKDKVGAERKRILIQMWTNRYKPEWLNI